MSKTAQKEFKQHVIQVANLGREIINSLEIRELNVDHYRAMRHDDNGPFKFEATLTLHDEQFTFKYKHLEKYRAEVLDSSNRVVGQIVNISPTFTHNARARIILDEMTESGRLFGILFSGHVYDKTDISAYHLSAREHLCLEPPNIKICHEIMLSLLEECKGRKDMKSVVGVFENLVKDVSINRPRSADLKKDLADYGTVLERCRYLQVPLDLALNCYNTPTARRILCDPEKLITVTAEDIINLVANPTLNRKPTAFRI